MGRGVSVDVEVVGLARTGESGCPSGEGRALAVVSDATAQQVRKGCHGEDGLGE